MSTSNDDKPKPPTNYRAIRGVTERNLIIGFIVIVFVIGLGLIGFVYGGGAFLGGLSCVFLGIGLVGVIALVMLGLGKFSEWLDRRLERSTYSPGAQCARRGISGAHCHTHVRL